MSTLSRALGILVHHALNELSFAVEDEEVRGCCPQCCAPCEALKILDDEGILDAAARCWPTFDDGTATLRPRNPSWWTGTEVDRTWLHSAWSDNALSCTH
jgi:hypothetical protein